MEIITYVRTGAITHQDSMGNKGRTGAGDVQVMSAGSGVTHAEYNLEGEETTLFQIWVETDQPGAKPGWGMMPFPKEAREGDFQLLASGDPDDGALTIHADARVLGATLKRRQEPVLRRRSGCAISTWFRRPRCESTGSRPTPAMESPSPARSASRSRRRPTRNWCWSTHVKPWVSP